MGQLQTTHHRFDWHPIRWLREHLGARREDGEAIFPRRTPPLEVAEGSKGMIATFEVPGLRPEDLEIELVGRRLVVRGHQERDREEKGDGFFYTERSFGGFVRAFQLPDDIDPQGIEAHLDRGVLTVEAPYLPGAGPKKIPVGRGS